MFQKQPFVILFIISLLNLYAIFARDVSAHIVREVVKQLHVYCKQ